MPGNALYNVCGTAGNHPGNKQEIPKEDGYAIEVDTSETHSLLKHLGRHKLRSKIEMRKLDLFCVYALWNDEVKDWTPPGLDPETEGLDGTILTDNRAPGLGKRSLFHIHAREKKYPPFEGLEKAYKRQYKLRRHRLAVPEGQLEIPSRTALPMNYNMDLMGAIDFKKGCYVGQELTIRTHHTGVTRKRVLPVQVYDPDHDPPVEWSWSDRWRYECPVAGTKFSMEGHPGSPGMWIDGLKNTGLALCNLREMTDLRIDEEPSPPDKETKIFTSVKGSKDILGVKAFVPEWLRDKIRPAKVQKRVG